MMNPQPDKLFREKLHGYQQPVSPGTWNRISQNAGQKSRRILWLRVAATVLLLATSSIFIYPALRRNATNHLANNPVSPKNQERGGRTSDLAIEPSTKPLEKSPAKSNENVSAENTAPVPAVTHRQNAMGTEKKKSRQLPNPQPKNTQSPVEIPQSLYNKEHVAAIIDVTRNGDVENLSTLTISEQTLKKQIVTSRNVKIVFTTEEVNEKYLAKIADAEATPEAKETSGLKKLLDKASDLKNNQNLLGDLRQRKNEILAMNFKNEKERTEND